MSSGKPARIKQIRKASRLMKILVVGDSGVNKTGLLQTFTEPHHGRGAAAGITVGVDFLLKTIVLDGEAIKMQLWDTAGRAAGQERFRTITSAYYRGGAGVMLVYDVTQEESFLHMEEWFREVSEHAGSHVVKMLIGNKCLMRNKRMVTKERGEKLARKYGVRFMETNSKPNINVDEAFFTLARDIVAEQKGLSLPSLGRGDSVCCFNRYPGLYYEEELHNLP